MRGTVNKVGVCRCICIHTVTVQIHYTIRMKQVVSDQVGSGYVNNGVKEELPKEVIDSCRPE